MSVDLSDIQKLANEAAGKEQPVIDFPIPQGCECEGGEWIEVKDIPEKNGKGFFAKKDIEAGTMLLAAKPLSLVMDWEDEEDTEEEDDEMMSLGENDVDVMRGSKRNGLLIIKAAQSMKDDPSVWYDQMSNLFPRDLSEDMPMWMCEDAVTGMQIEDAISQLSSVKEFTEEDVEEIRQRLPLIVRYNCLSVETAPELFVHPNRDGGGHVTMSGTGLYYHPSFFNHSCKPNVARYAIGDVMFFCTNQNIVKGQELCISYIESEILCESANVRSRLLDMDFEDTAGGASDGGKGDASNGYDDSAPVVDLDMQDELMSIHPIERLDELNGLIEDAKGGGRSISGSGDDKIDVFWFKCDEHQLRILLALTFDNLGQPSKAIKEWEQCIAFSEENFPPGKLIFDSTDET